MLFTLDHQVFERYTKRACPPVPIAAGPEKSEPLHKARPIDQCRTAEGVLYDSKFTSIPSGLIGKTANDMAVLCGASFERDSLGAGVASLRTGDMGFMDRQGVSFVGRSSTTRKISGTSPCSCHSRAFLHLWKWKLLLFRLSYT